MANNAIFTDRYVQSRCIACSEISNQDHGYSWIYAGHAEGYLPLGNKE